MDSVIKQISEIEKSAAAVMDAAAARKKAFATEMEEKTRQFDQTAEEETEKKIQELRGQMEERMKLELAGQKKRAEKQLAQMQDNYALHHEAYVKKLFEELIKE